MTQLIERFPLGVGGLEIGVPEDWRFVEAPELHSGGIVAPSTGGFTTNVMFTRTDDDPDVPLDELVPGHPLFDTRPDDALVRRIGGYLRTELGFSIVVTQLWLTTADGGVLVTASIEATQLERHLSIVRAIVAPLLGETLAGELERWI